MKIKNATVVFADLESDERRGFVITTNVNFGSSVAAPMVSLDNKEKFFEIFGIKMLSQMSKQPVRCRFNEDRDIIEIGHYLNDEWVDIIG